MANASTAFEVIGFRNARAIVSADICNIDWPGALPAFGANQLSHYRWKNRGVYSSFGAKGP